MPNPNLALAVVNTLNNQPVVYIGQAAELAVTLTNNMGFDVPLTPNSSVLQILMPEFYAPGDLGNMKIALTDWTFAVDTANDWLTLTYACANAGIWANGASMQFNITNASSSHDADTDYVQINPVNMGKIPAQVQTPSPLSLISPPAGKAKLTDSMEISVDGQGSIYVSSAGDPLYNSMFLNIKNKGTVPFYNGKNAWPKMPEVIVTFVYGQTSGALAPDNDKKAPQTGSAWNISASIPISQNNVWSAIPANESHPKWLLQPSKTVPGILGIGDSANITFEFSQIVSETPIGHTQMTVVFKNFYKDDNTPYDDETFILDVVKQAPPPTRGAVGFFGLNPIAKVFSAKQPIPINLRWTLFDVASVNLITSFPGISPVSKKYSASTPVQYDTATVNIPGVTVDTPVFLTLQTFDGYGGYLNSLQFTVFVQSMVFNDPRDNKAYSTVQVGNQVWMAQNLDYDAGDQSCFYNHDGSNEAKLGRLYTFAGAQKNLPPGWRLPSKADWQALVNTFPNAYDALICCQDGGFNAPLGGWGTGINGNFTDSGNVGYFWTASETDPSDAYFVEFSSGRKLILLDNTYPMTSVFSVRYVKDL